MISRLHPGTADNHPPGEEGPLPRIPGSPEADLDGEPPEKQTDG
jgi:hypothetical protein